MKNLLTVLFLCLTIFTKAQKIESKLNIPLKAAYDSTTGSMLIGLEDFPKGSKPKVKLPNNVKSLKYFKVKYIPLNVNERLFVIVGLKQNDDRVFYVDVNQNGDFTDDNEMVFSSKLIKNRYYKSAPVVIISNKYLDNDKEKQDKIVFLVMPFFEFYQSTTPFEKKTNYSICLQNRYYADINILDKIYTIDVYPRRLAFSHIQASDLKGKFLIIYCNKKVTKGEKKPVDLGKLNYLRKDSIFFDSLNYRLDGVSNNLDTLKLSFARVEKDSTKVGNLIANFKVLSLKTDSVEWFYNKKHKYALIDFWGTWCKGCIAIMPDIEKLHAQYASKGLSVFSIGCPKSVEELVKTKEFVLNNKMQWTQFYDMSISNSRKVPIDLFYAKKKLGINSFPTIILVDENNKIIEKAEDTVDFKSKIEPLIHRLFQNE